MHLEMHRFRSIRKTVYINGFYSWAKIKSTPELNPRPNVQNFTFLFPNFTKKKNNWEKIKPMFRTYNAHTHVLYGVCPSNQLHFNKYEHGYDYGHKRGSSKPNKLFIFNLKDHVRIFLFQLFGAHCAHVCAFEVWCTKRLLFLFYFYSFSLNFTYYSRFFFSCNLFNSMS